MGIRRTNRLSSTLFRESDSGSEAAAATFRYFCSFRYKNPPDYRRLFYYVISNVSQRSVALSPDIRPIETHVSPICFSERTRLLASRVGDSRSRSRSRSRARAREMRVPITGSRVEFAGRSERGKAGLLGPLAVLDVTGDFIGA